MKNTNNLVKFLIWCAGVGIFIIGMFFYSGALSSGNLKENDEWDFHFNGEYQSNVHISGGDELKINEVKQFIVDNGGNFNLSSCGGDVEIKTWDSNKVQIQWVNWKHEREIKRFRVETKQEGNTVKVVGTQHHSLFSWWKSDHVKFLVMLPKNFNPNIEVSGGDVNIQEITGNVKIETSGGDVVVNKVIGPVHIETSGGDVGVNEINGDVYAETSGGDIRLEKVNGNIKSETSGGDIIASVTNDSVDVKCETSGGDITIYVPETAKAQLYASTSGGDVQMKIKNNFQGKIKDDEVSGTINGGGKKISVETSGGDIRILNL